MSLVDVPLSTSPGEYRLFCGLVGQGITLDRLLPTPPQSEIYIERLILWVGDLPELASLLWIY